MKNKIFILVFALFLVACARVDPFLLTKKLNPNYEEIKIFWSDSIKEVAFNDQVIKKQGPYYLIPKKYKLTWKYKVIEDHETVYKWKSSTIDITDAKEVHFEKGKVLKK